MEYIFDIERKRTEDGVYADFQPQDGLPLMTENEDPDRWFMDRVMKRAVRLWKGEQVDGSVLEWGGLDANGYYERVIDILQSPCAVMAGYRYITSLKSTPRHLRAPMHESLFR